MSSSMSSSARLLHVGAAALVSAAVIGFLSGVDRFSPDVARGASTVGPYGSGGRPTPGYSDLRKMQRGPNAHLHDDGAFGALSSEPDLFAEVKQTSEDRARTLAARATRRAYDGAPPTIPHAVDQASGKLDCRGCHDRGTVIEGRRAPRMSHAPYQLCTQCHVPSGGARPGAPMPPPLTENTFVGKAAVAEGPRAWPGAPPQMPHSTYMRTECSSCHGTGGSLGMRTTHPWRQSCEQCHVPVGGPAQRAVVPIHPLP